MHRSKLEPLSSPRSQAHSTFKLTPSTPLQAVLEPVRQVPVTELGAVARSSNPSLLLHLQRQYGNRQVQRVLKAANTPQSTATRSQPASPSRTVQRFGSEEHTEIGNRALPGQDVYIGSEVSRVSYGELIAMAGDYFESMSQIQSLANDIYGRDQILFVLWKVNPTVRPRPPVSRAVEETVMDRYYRLAARNEAHFTAGSAPGRSNREQYIAGHTDAIQEAYSHGRSGITHSPEWQAREAFANHFLTDAFSGGHIRTPRGEIQRHWNGLYPNFTNNLIRMISCYMASYINDRDNIGYAATVNDLAEGIAPILQAKAGNILSAFSIGDLISKVLHDQDNAGLDVVSSQGVGTSTMPFRWRAVGDEYLFHTPPGVAVTPALAQAQQQTQQMVTEAVRLSFEEARQAYAAGASGNPPLSSLTDPTRYRALALIPSADPASTRNPAQEWRAPNIRAMAPSLRSLLLAAFAPGTEVRQGLDGVSVDCITVKPINVGGFNIVNFDLHTRDAFLCFKQLFLADIIGMIINVAEGNLCPPGQNNPCPNLRNPCP